jgi:hypothetical protein
MAILQAARAKQLGLSESRAKSWGLNRAIFYAAAKRGFKHGTKTVGRGTAGKGRVARAGKEFFLGTEMAYAARKGGRVYFTIGGEVQTEANFKRQVEARFGNGFGRAWTESLGIVRQYPKEALESPNRFFNEIYRPRRDVLAAKWTEASE